MLLRYKKLIIWEKVLTTSVCVKHLRLCSVLGLNLSVKVEVLILLFL